MVKKGYKHTEIGIIPEDWDVASLEEIADVIGGGTPSTNIAKFWNGSINWFTPTEVGYNKYLYCSNRKITEDGLNNSSAKILPKKSILLTTRAGIGDLGIIATEASTNQGFQSLVSKDGIDNEFLYYLISISKGQLLKKASGSTFLEISPNNVKSIKLPIPTLTEQKAIAQALTDVDDLITEIDKLIAKKKAIKQGAMQELLTRKKRLKGFTGDWETRKLGEVANMSSGGTPLTSIRQYYSGSIPWMVISDITKAGKYINSTEKKITELGVENSSTVIYPKGTLFFAMYASIGKCTISKVEMTCNQAILGITPHSVNTEYLFYHLSSLENKLKNAGQTGTQSNLNKEIVMELNIPFPKIEEQKAIAQILSDMDTEIEQLEQKLSKYKMVKQGLMQNLLTGKIRLV